MGSSTTAPQPSPSTSTPASASYYCSPGICTSICLQFCTAANTGYLLGPPPPLFTVDDSPDDSSGSRVSPLMIALISVLAAAFLLLSYYTFAYKYCKRRRSRWSQNDALEDELQLQTRLDQLVLQDSSAASVQFAAPAVNSNGGLDEQFIRSITVFKYKRGDGLVESTDCAVCLTEFKEEESLRLMPNCQHAFHPPCIDTWLRSHSNCPICRASMIGAPPPPPPPPVRRPPPVVSRMRFHSGGDVVVVVDGGGVRDRVREIGTDRRDLDHRRQVSPAPEERDVDLTVVNDEKERERGRSNH